MSDVTVAPQGGAPAAAPASTPAPANEAVINLNQVSSPSPVGPQAPNKPADQPPSRREAIEAAFKRADNPQAAREKPAQRPAARAAEAKPGHNNPPEETPKLDLKRRPDDQPQRGEHGHFAARQPVNQPEIKSPPNAPDNSPSANLRPPPKQLPKHAPFATPPARISERARYDWADTPETVRGDMHRMQSEFQQAYQYYKDDHEAFKPIKHFHQLAQSHGTTLEKALTNYVSMEKMLREDPVAGLDVIINNLALTTPDGQRIGFRDIAYHVLSQSPEQLKQIQQGNVQQAAAHQIGQLHQQVQGLQNQLRQMHNQQQFTYTRSAVEQFADTHPRFDELGVAVEDELKFGFDLETAYRRADLLHPATHAAQTRTTPAQTRPADRSISGAPDVAPSNGASRRPRVASPTPRDAVQNAMRRLNGGGL